MTEACGWAEERSAVRERKKKKSQLSESERRWVSLDPVCPKKKGGTVVGEKSGSCFGLGPCCLKIGYFVCPRGCLQSSANMIDGESHRLGEAR